MGADRDEIFETFDEAVNMTPSELEDWLASDEARSVGSTGSGNKTGSGGEESIGHQSGRRILDILNTTKGDLTDADFDHMKKVAGYVARHSKQRPSKDVEDSRWRYSLMNWGHDPLK